MKFIAKVIFGALFIFSCVAEESYDCIKIDERLIYCPIPQPPHHVPMEPGSILVEYTVLPSGAVTDVKVIESNGPDAWIKSVKSALKKWRFKPSENSARKQWRFTYDYAE